MATYYVDPVSGNDANAGTSLALAFKTTQKAADTAVAGDTVYLCATGVETIAAKIDLDTNAGTELSPIRFRGANASGVVDGTRYVIRPSSAVAAILDFAAAVDYTKWFDIEFDANSLATNAIGNTVADGSDFHLFRRCRFHGATGVGFYVRGSSAAGWQLYNCECDHNGGDGVAHSASNRGRILWEGGSIHHNGGNGWSVNGNNCLVRGVKIYRNADHGVDLQSNTNNFPFVSNTVYANGGSGLRFFTTASGRAMNVIHDNTSVGNTRYGFEFQSGTTEVGWFMDYNHTYNNTLGASDLTLPGDYNKTGDPLFASTTDGSEDFTPQAGSPLIGAGLSGGEIGALPGASGSTGNGDDESGRGSGR